MTDQAADGIQNMNIQDYEGSEFDPFGPQQSKMTSLQTNGDGTDLDLIGNSVGPEVPNGHDKFVSFDPGMTPAEGHPAPVQGHSREKVQRHMSTGEILGYQNEYGESSTGQMEYEGYSDEEGYGDGNGRGNYGGDVGGNLVDYENGPPALPDPVLPDPQTDQDYYMSTGQPLVDFGSENVQHGGQLVDHGQGYDHSMGEEFVQNTGDYSSQGCMDEFGQDDSDIRGQESFPDDDCDNDETEPSSWAPEMDAERARRSLSPERSVSPREITSQSGADMISSPQYDTDSFADTGDISSPSEMVPHPSHSDAHSFIPAGDQAAMIGSPASRDLSPQPSITESESSYSYADSKGSPSHRIPRPKKKKKPLALPPWDDNVVIPPMPRMKPTLIGKQADLPPPSSPQRPRTAPSLFTRKDASSDSGVEDDKTAKSPRKTTCESKLKRYGTDSKNQAYKPSGGNVAIFSEKVDIKAAARTDSSRPRSAMSPRPLSERSPSTPKPPTPNTKQVQSKIGSLKNAKHKPGGGDVTVLSAKTDFTNVKSRVGSKDKMDHKPKGGEKKIEVQKLEWKAESKVGSLKNATHSPGGGNVKEVTLDIEPQPSHSYLADGQDSVDKTAVQSENKHQWGTTDSLDGTNNIQSVEEGPVRSFQGIVMQSDPAIGTWESDVDVKGITIQSGPVTREAYDSCIANSSVIQADTDKLQVVYMTKEELKNILPDFNETDNVRLVSQRYIDHNKARKYDADEPCNSIDRKEFILHFRKTPSVIYSVVSKPKYMSQNLKGSFTPRIIDEGNLSTDKEVNKDGETDNKTRPHMPDNGKAGGDLTRSLKDNWTPINTSFSNVKTKGVKTLPNKNQSGVASGNQGVNFMKAANITTCVNNVDPDLTEIDGIINTAFDMSSSCSDTDSIDSDISDREISFAQIELKGRQLRPRQIQTTTFKYRVNPGPATPFEVKQSQIYMGTAAMVCKKAGIKLDEKKNTPFGYHNGLGPHDVLDKTCHEQKTKCKPYRGTSMSLPRKPNYIQERSVPDDRVTHQSLVKSLIQSQEKLDTLEEKIKQLHIAKQHERPKKTNLNVSSCHRQGTGIFTVSQTTLEAVHNTDQIDSKCDAENGDHDVMKRMKEPRIKRAVSNISTQHTKTTLSKETQKTAFRDELKAVLACMNSDNEACLIHFPVITAGSCSETTPPGTPTVHTVQPTGFRYHGDQSHHLNYLSGFSGHNNSGRENATKSRWIRPCRSQSLMINKNTKEMMTSDILMSMRESLKPTHGSGPYLNTIGKTENTIQGTRALIVGGPNGRLNNMDKPMILDQKVEIKAQSKVGSTANLKHKPGGGDKKIETQKLEFTDKAKSKVGSMDKVKHTPGGGDVKILDEKLDFTDKATSKVGSMDKIKHQPGGGDKLIETQKLSFKETAKPRTNTGIGGEKEKSRSQSRTESVCSSQDDSLQG